jgi:hypothetical protein
MDYYQKYLKYKTKYIELKDSQQNNNNILVGGAKKQKNKKKCTINDTDKILFGDGGSSAIVVITKDKRVYKIFTFYNYIPAIELDKQIKDNNMRIENEIKIYELLTKNIINKNISNHIVKYIDSNNCTNAKSLFNKCPKSYIEFMKLAQNQKTRMCQ